MGELEPVEYPPDRLWASVISFCKCGGMLRRGEEGVFEPLAMENPVVGEDDREGGVCPSGSATSGANCGRLSACEGEAGLLF